ncbi:tyrosine-type recombinase/integrase [Polycladomyces subterraneus]|uniref:Tyrosine-type recombinase/integrase n=1 Tax=Polycladomyces subterraneus TaxID=1016997 RepID=A0ABT8INY9_9BACL|nr:tyrosine-type recombinase/integrase [Polycladomyces subterraneus]MDN4594498.1 tyrosine-type recombinase/integrase [Polycladomyces subterraneus]
MAAVQQHGSRDQTIILMMLHTGLRTMEVCNLKPRDVTIGKRSGTLVVRSGKRNKQREVPLNATIREALTVYFETLPADTEYLFSSKKTGQRLTERALRYLIQKYIRLAQIMGHDSLDTTMIYIQATREDLRLRWRKLRE